MAVQITAAPTAPNRNQDEDTFSVNGDNFLGWIENNLVPEANALCTEVNSKATQAAASATTSQTQATIAQNAANSATASVGVSAWVSGTTYTAGQQRYSLLNFQTYRRKTNGAGATDPANDGTNWEPIYAMTIPSVAAPATYTVQRSDKGKMLRFSANATVTFPAVSTLGEGWYCFVQNNGSGSTSITMLGTGGENFQGYTQYGVPKDGCAIVSVTGAQLSVMPFTPRSFGRFGSTLASSSSLNLDANEGDICYVSQSGNINTITLSTGVRKTAIFTGNSVLINSSNIVTATGRNMHLADGSAVTFVGKPDGSVHVVGAGNTNTGYLLIRDEKPSGTSGSALTSGINTVTLNTLAHNTITGASLSGNQIILPGGLYEVRATIPVRGSTTSSTMRARSFLQNITDGTVAAEGSSVSCGVTSNVEVLQTTLEGLIYIQTQKVFELQLFAQNVSVGVAVSDGIKEVFSQLVIRKVS